MVTMSETDGTISVDTIAAKDLLKGVTVSRFAQCFIQTP